MARSPLASVLSGASLLIDWRTQLREDPALGISSLRCLRATLPGVSRDDPPAKAVFTNTTTVTSYRGAGRPEAIYFTERLLDKAAPVMKLDPADIRRRNFIYVAYGMPRADMSPVFAVSFEEVACLTNPLGVKGIGEAGAIASPPTIINAILDAMAPFGVTDIEMAATPERVGQAISKTRSAEAS